MASEHAAYNFRAASDDLPEDVRKLVGSRPRTTWPSSGCSSSSCATGRCCGTGPDKGRRRIKLTGTNWREPGEQVPMTVALSRRAMQLMSPGTERLPKKSSGHRVPNCYGARAIDIGRDERLKLAKFT
jgi:hypothetical protein